MNNYLLVSGILAVVLCVVHSVAGELIIIGPIQKVEGLPPAFGSPALTRMTLRFAWHVTSVFGIGIAAILFRLGQQTAHSPSDIMTLRILSATFLASFAVALIGSRAKHPSWPVFLLMAILTWCGAGTLGF